ncbi:glycosyltransferase family A protein [Maridesulfovibrio hydrothermalis]|uniref:Glycosyl transferase family 2 n=1 Tax=Maridesulfovibrio hydrothermalis AM13 = DSM 14728 TaxID=1121451 RepID=L0RF69_9BACT|nr:glycosyltransferase family 2 protein [Maridesulfovibrio hydrothermalis]CCO24216.1 Glycosyl transferase family 2 [Maridesulfovibrio hydrothermalis AM13 = DSM 14728]
MNGSFWGLLDSASRYRLLVSGHGKPHLMETANIIINSAEGSNDKGALIDVGVDMFLAAWESSPLDGQLASNLLAINQQLNFLPEQLAETLSLVASNSSIPENISYLQRLVAKDDKAKLLEYLSSQTERQPENLFWLSHLIDLAFFMGRHDVASVALARGWPSGMNTVLNKYAGDIAFCSGDYEQAELIYSDTSGGALILGENLLRLAESVDRMGRRDEALVLWRDRMTARPWQVNTWLKVYDRLLGNDGLKRLKGRVAVCLYTYGKGHDFNETMKALAASRLDNVHVFALNNGSSDITGQVLKSWKDKLGDSFTAIELPVNIGAPAARNWLKNLDEIKAYDYVAYLDDDALIPVDWQEHFSAAVDAYPDAGVWGCKVVNEGQEEVIQHADLHLKETSHNFEDIVRSFEFAYLDPYNQDLDYGQFDYCRPCVSVTGCFHLFKQSVLHEIGDFDLRYSPTQYDDVDHDLMLSSIGKTAVYQGSLKVLHKRKSGSATSVSRSARGSGAGNVLKLESKYEASDIAEIIGRDAQRLENDFTEKSLKLGQVMKEME